MRLWPLGRRRSRTRPDAGQRRRSVTLRTPTFWISVLTMLVILYVVVGDVGRTSPGPLALAHQNVAALSGWRSCSQCHGGWFGDMGSACLECHEVIEEQLAAGKGLHGNLGRERASQCAYCHSDHNGSSFALANEQSFKRAGFADSAGFDHGIVDFAIAGRHAELACNECHRNADAILVPEDEHRFLGLSRDCASCHEDKHEGQMQIACASCHGQDTFQTLQASDHDQHLDLVGSHGEVGCRDCHQKDGAHSLERLGRGDDTEPRQCQSCHSSPHAERFTVAVAGLLEQPPAASCAACHAPTDPGFAKAEATMSAELHAATGFELTPPHDAQDCAACHDREVPGFRERYPGRDADTCQSCHQDPHGGQFQQSVMATGGCLSCHERQQFDPHTFDRERHAELRLPLTGSHLERDCVDCHKQPDRSQPRQFHGTSAQCADCHRDGHDGFFEAVTGTAGGQRIACSTCHQATEFAAVEDFDHHKWTKFPIRGAHAQEECAGCHEASAEPDANGRSFGRVRQLRGVAKSVGRLGCVTCHDDPHRRQFDGEDLPVEVDGRRDCARCHSENSFRSLVADFDHGVWTGFSLQGAHRQAECTACHKHLDQPAAQGRALGRVKGKDCTSCHSSPHAGQFRSKSCADCHQPAAAFTVSTFDHEIQSRFKLGERHAKVACGKCHATEERGSERFVRYRPMGTQCTDCHATQDNPLRRRKGK